MMYSAHGQVVGIFSTARRAVRTSRPVGVPGEHVTRVPPMSVPTTEELGVARSLDALAHHDSASLFVDRAADLGTWLSDDHARTVGRLVHALEGMPLAIELAAARTATLSVADILDRLVDGLAILVGADRIARPHHHRTLTATLTWSHKPCSPIEQLLWARPSGSAGRQRRSSAPSSRFLPLLDRDGRPRLLSRRETELMTRIREELPNIRTALSSASSSDDVEIGLKTVLNLNQCRGWLFARSLSEARYWSRTLLGRRHLPAVLRR